MKLSVWNRLALPASLKAAPLATHSLVTTERDGYDWPHVKRVGLD